VHSDEFTRSLANPAQEKCGTKFGDSGGPVLLKGKRITLAVNSHRTNYECVGVAYSSRSDAAVVLEWINGFFNNQLMQRYWNAQYVGTRGSRNFITYFSFIS